MSSGDDEDTDEEEIMARLPLAVVQVPEQETAGNAAVSDSFFDYDWTVIDPNKSAKENEEIFDSKCFRLLDNIVDSTLQLQRLFLEAIVYFGQRRTQETFAEPRESAVNWLMACSTKSKEYYDRWKKTSLQLGVNKTMGSARWRMRYINVQGVIYNTMRSVASYIVQVRYVADSKGMNELPPLISFDCNPNRCSGA